MYTKILILIAFMPGRSANKRLLFGVTLRYLA